MKKAFLVAALVGMVLCWFFLPSVWAEGGEQLFKAPEDIVLIWARRTGLSVMIFASLLVLFVLCTLRNRLGERLPKILLFLGICLLPIPVALLSAAVGMEESKGIEFCSACHEPMGPFVNDLLDAESETLAAVHYKNQFIQHDHCWTCHSDYGITGTARAKFKGLQDMPKVIFDTWEAPIRLQHPYNWKVCLQCHGNSARFHSEESHEGVISEVLGGETSCTDCHDAAHPAPEERSTK